MRPLLAAAFCAVLLVPAAVSAQCTAPCSELLCAEGSRGAVEATLVGEPGASATRATITRVYGTAVDEYEEGDTLEVPAVLGFLPGEEALFVVATGSGEILGAAAVEDGVVLCGQFPLVESLVPLALADDCFSALRESGLDAPECVDDDFDDDFDESGCAVGCGAGVGFLALLGLGLRAAW